MTAPEAGLFDCRSCGACCAFSADWPRFSTESDEALDRIPERFIENDGGGMRCVGNRCSALSGTVGKEVSCGIYHVRPDVCRTCMPGDAECLTARGALGLTALETESPALQ